MPIQNFLLSQESHKKLRDTLASGIDYVVKNSTDRNNAELVLNLDETALLHGLLSTVRRGPEEDFALVWESHTKYQWPIVWGVKTKTGYLGLVNYSADDDEDWKTVVEWDERGNVVSAWSVPEDAHGLILERVNRGVRFEPRMLGVESKEILELVPLGTGFCPRNWREYITDFCKNSHFKVLSVKWEYRTGLVDSPAQKHTSMRRMINVFAWIQPVAEDFSPFLALYTVEMNYNEKTDYLACVWSQVHGWGEPENRQLDLGFLQPLKKHSSRPNMDVFIK